jgi:hypothetical protein
MMMFANLVTFAVVRVRLNGRYGSSGYDECGKHKKRFFHGWLED